MSRVLKFRAWDKWQKKMLAPHDGDFIGWHGPSNWKSCYEVMQFTGLLDSAGVEIYEGDIVRHKYYTAPQKVEYDAHCAGYAPFVYDEGNGFEIEYSTVIGNIYEHPSLLERTA